MSINKNKIYRITSIGLLYGLILFSFYIHIELLKAYQVNDIPLIEDVEDKNSRYFMLSDESNGKTYDLIFIAKGTLQNFMDVNEKTHNRLRLENFKDTYLFCAAKKICIENFNKKELIDVILNSWKKYYEDFDPNK